MQLPSTGKADLTPVHVQLPSTGKTDLIPVCVQVTYPAQVQLTSPALAAVVGSPWSWVVLGSQQCPEGVRMDLSLDKSCLPSGERVGGLGREHSPSVLP